MTHELPQLDETRCTGCGDCVACCPTACLAMDGALPGCPGPATASAARCASSCAPPRHCAWRSRRPPEAQGNHGSPAGPLLFGAGKALAPMRFGQSVVWPARFRGLSTQSGRGRPVSLLGSWWLRHPDPRCSPPSKAASPSLVSGLGVPVVEGKDHIRNDQAWKQLPAQRQTPTSGGREATIPRLPGGVPERPKGTGCKPVGSAYGGSNPPAPMFGFQR